MSKLSHTYWIFENGHRWEVNTCTQCGTVRTNLSVPKQHGRGAEKSRTCFSKDGFKTIDTKAGNCFVKLSPQPY